jgi:hypothetical protein
VNALGPCEPEGSLVQSCVVLVDADPITRPLVLCRFDLAIGNLRQGTGLVIRLGELTAPRSCATTVREVVVEGRVRDGASLVTRVKGS